MLMVLPNGMSCFLKSVLEKGNTPTKRKDKKKKKKLETSIKQKTTFIHFRGTNIRDLCSVKNFDIESNPQRVTLDMSNFDVAVVKEVISVGQNVLTQE